MDDAEILPVFLITLAISWLADPAAITTRPPLTSTTRLFSTRALYVPTSTLTDIRELPLKSRVICSPAAIATVPDPFLANR